VFSLELLLIMPQIALNRKMVFKIARSQFVLASFVVLSSASAIPVKRGEQKTFLVGGWVD
jgi:hypothetical protein